MKAAASRRWGAREHAQRGPSGVGEPAMLHGAIVWPIGVPRVFVLAMLGPRRYSFTLALLRG